MKKYSVFKVSDSYSMPYTISIRASKEDHATGIANYLIFLGFGKNMFGTYEYWFEHGERKIGESLNLGKSITRHLDSETKKLFDSIVKEEFGE